MKENMFALSCILQHWDGTGSWNHSLLLTRIYFFRMYNTMAAEAMATAGAMASGAPLQWRHNGHDSISNHQPHNCLLNCLFRRRWKKTSKLRVTGLCVGNSPLTGEFPAQMSSNAENVSIWWRHHAIVNLVLPKYSSFRTKAAVIYLT